MADELKVALKWFNENCQTLGKRYKDQWIAISRTGVKKHSNSFKKVADFAAENKLLVVKVPKNPSAAYIY